MRRKPVPAGAPERPGGDVDGVDVGICRAAEYFEQRAKLLRMFTQQPTERIGVE